jgi:hypothetical protein
MGILPPEQRPLRGARRSVAPVGLGAHIRKAECFARNALWRRTGMDRDFWRFRCGGRRMEMAYRRVQ